MLWQLFIFIILTALFFFIIVYKTNQSRCCPTESKCFDGNGKYQYKGRGYKDESVDVLLSRIDWLAKNSENNALYTTAYIIAFTITLSVVFVIYAFSYYVASVWEIIIILFVSFILCFSILNLFDFHTNRYPYYYIRKNIDYISRKLSISHKIREPPNPSKKSHLPFRTKIRDVLTK